MTTQPLIATCIKTYSRRCKCRIKQKCKFKHKLHQCLGGSCVASQSKHLGRDSQRNLVVNFNEKDYFRKDNDAHQNPTPIIHNLRPIILCQTNTQTGFMLR